MLFHPSNFNHQYAVCDGYKYHYVDEGNKNGITILLVHGFPDLWFGWRHQIASLTGTGRYRVIAVDLLGYGETDKPRHSSEDECFGQSDDDALRYCSYSPKTIASHLVELLDHLGVDKAVMIGHDWGTGIVSRVGWHYPDRIHATIAIGNPFRPVTEHYISVDDLVNENPAFQYFEYFASPQAIIDMDERAEDLIADLLTDESGYSDEERQYYIHSFKKGGFHGPLAYYKCFEASHQEDFHLVGQRFKTPSLLLIVSKDPILSTEYCLQVPHDYFDQLEIDMIQDGGHWVLTQNPEEVNRKIFGFLDRIFEVKATERKTGDQDETGAGSFLSAAHRRSEEVYDTNDDNHEDDSMDNDSSKLQGVSAEQGWRCDPGRVKPETELWALEDSKNARQHQPKSQLQQQQQQRMTGQGIRSRGSPGYALAKL